MLPEILNFLVFGAISGLAGAELYGPGVMFFGKISNKTRMGAIHDFMNSLLFASDCIIMPDHDHRSLLRTIFLYV